MYRQAGHNGDYRQAGYNGGYNPRHLSTGAPTRKRYPSQYFQPDKIEENDIWRSQVCPHSKVLLIGDSLVKYVQKLNNTQVLAFKGITIEQLAVRIKQDKIPHLAGKRLVLTHVGTNNVETDSPESMVAKTNFLIDMIRAKLPEVPIMISLIIPRPKDFDVLGKTVLKYNYMMYDLSKRLKITCLPTYRKFLFDRRPISKLYAGDKLHLKPDGITVLTSYFSSSLGNPKKENQIKKTKRSPPETIIMERIKKPKIY